MEHYMKTFEQRQLATFKGEPVETVVWQPRFSDWYSQNNIKNLKPADLEPGRKIKCPDLPVEILGMEHWEIYDYLDASPRYPSECWPGMGFFHAIPAESSDVTVSPITHDHAGNRVRKITTPHGVLRESWRAGSSYPDERVLKSRDDFKAVIDYLEWSCGKFEFNQTMYEVYLEENEGRCVSVAGPWRTPYNKCIVELAGTMKTMILMKRYPEEFDELCQVIERINKEIIMPSILKSPVEFVSFGDNVDSMNCPPPVYEKYILPVFQDLEDACKKHGKYTFAHFDGHLKDLLPYLSDDLYPFDGIEAPTVLPQGDVSLKEFRDALGENVIVLDGIPSTIFLPHFTEKEFDKLVNDILEAFSPRLILGVSDEFPPNGMFARLQKVASLVSSHKP